jgi:hypothetical protein
MTSSAAARQISIFKGSFSNGMPCGICTCSFNGQLAGLRLHAPTSLEGYLGFLSGSAADSRGVYLAASLGKYLYNTAFIRELLNIWHLK